MGMAESDTEIDNPGRSRQNFELMASETLRIRAHFPDGIQADVLGQFNALGGWITFIEQEGDSRTAIRGTIPQENSATFRTWFQGFGGGKGSITEDSP